MSLNVAVIGTGRIGTEHAQYIGQHKEMNLCSCADRSPEGLEVFKKKFGIESGYTDHKEMLAVEKPDVVTIATYVGTHCQMIVDAVEAGVKGIVCEKPFLAAPAELKIVRDLIAQSGVKIVVPHMRRYLPVFAAAKKHYCSGDVGEPVMCMAGYEGRDLSEYGSHWLDMFRYFNNDAQAEWVMAQCRMSDGRIFEHATEEHGILTCGFAGGGRAYLDGGKGLNGPYSMILVGTEGSIRIEGENALTIIGKNSAWERTDYEGTVPEKWNADKFNYEFDNEWVAVWDVLFDELVNWMAGGPEPMTGATNMLHTAELTLAAYLSVVRRDRVDLPLTDFSDTQWPLEALV